MANSEARLVARRGYPSHLDTVHFVIRDMMEDYQGCVVQETTSEHTKTACTGFGTEAIDSTLQHGT